MGYHLSQFAFAITMIFSNCKNEKQAKAFYDVLIKGIDVAYASSCVYFKEHSDVRTSEQTEETKT